MDPIAIFESAYALTGNESEWIAGLGQVIRSNWEDDRWLMAWTFDARQPEVARANVCCGYDEAQALAGMRQLFAPMWDYQPRELFWRMNMVGTLRGAPARYRRMGVDEPRVREFERVLESCLCEWRLDDILWITVSDPTGIGCCIIAPMRRRGPLGAPEKHRWSCIAAHVETAFRIRRQFSAHALTTLEDPAHRPEAILGPDGKLHHAEQPATHERARTALRRAVRAIERARGSLRRSNADEAVAIWRALVDGRWSLLDHFDSDGRRFVVAHRNDARVADVRGLTLRERQVLAYAGLGHSNKIIAYELGLSTSTVSTHLARARKKMQLPLGVALNLTVSRRTENPEEEVPRPAARPGPCL
jgi:DNA-binding CsgD family transcriptional regulator